MRGRVGVKWKCNSVVRIQSNREEQNREVSSTASCHVEATFKANRLRYS